MRARKRSLTVVTVGAGLVLGATLLPAPLMLRQAVGPGPATQARLEPATTTQSICPGPEALGIRGLRSKRAQAVSVAAAAAPPASLPKGFAAAVGAGSLTMSGQPGSGPWPAPVKSRGQVVSSRISTARSVLVTGMGALAPGTVATQWSWSKAGLFRGLAAAACLPVTPSSWLVAGGGEPGRQEHLVLTNPGPNPVTVDLTVLGVNGPVEPPSGLALVVAGMGRAVVLLDAIAPSERSPVVHVVARGGEVAAVLSDTWLDGVVPRGSDDAVAVVEPAREQVISSVPINGRATLRVGVPGDTEAVVESRVLTSSGPRPLPTGGVTRVPGRSTRDIDLGSLPPGAYALQVRGDVPVVAAALLDRRRSAGEPSDLAWSVASAPIRTLAGLALPGSGIPGFGHRLYLAATRDPASVLLTTVGADRRVSTKRVAIAADSVTILSLTGATSAWVTPLAGQARAAVLTTAENAEGQLLTVTPLANLPLTTTTSPLRQLDD